MEPFVWNQPTVLRTRNPNAAINIIIRNANTTIYGLSTMEITQIKFVSQSIIGYSKNFELERAFRF